MGKKLDALLGRNFKTSKFKALVNVAISRLTVFKNQRQVRCSQARSDVVQLLSLGDHQRALLRVEQVIKEQNMLDVFAMVEGYCLLVIERVSLIEQEKECPDELKEAIASLLYASSRCGDFPELQQIRAVFTSHFGKEFVARAIELRNNCGVNPQMIQKLSTRQPSLENRMKLLKEIASESDIVLQLEEASSVNTKEKLDMNGEPNQPEPDPAANSSGTKCKDGLQVLCEEIKKDEQFCSSMKTRKYRDVADAAQAAFESAACAAAAARAAVELSRSEPHDPDDWNSPNPGQGKLSDDNEPKESKNETAGKKDSGELENLDVGLGFEKIHPVENNHSELEDETFHNESQAEGFKQKKNAAELMRSMSISSSASEDILKASITPLDELAQTKLMEKEIVFDDSDDESGNKVSSVPLVKTNVLGFDVKHSFLTNEAQKTEKSNSIRADDFSEGSGTKTPSSLHKQIPSRLQAGLKVESGPGEGLPHSNEGAGMLSAQGLNTQKKPISVRTRRWYGH